MFNFRIPMHRPPRKRIVLYSSKKDKKRLPWIKRQNQPWGQRRIPCQKMEKMPLRVTEQMKFVDQYEIVAVRCPPNIPRVAFQIPPKVINRLVCGELPLLREPQHKPAEDAVRKFFIIDRVKFHHPVGPRNLLVTFQGIHPRLNLVRVHNFCKLPDEHPRQTHACVSVVTLDSLNNDRACSVSIRWPVPIPHFINDRQNDINLPPSPIQAILANDFYTFGQGLTENIPQHHQRKNIN